MKKSSSSSGKLWDKIFPGIVIKKNTEEIKAQLNDLLESISGQKDKINEDVPFKNDVDVKKDEDKDAYKLALDIIKLRDQLLLAKYNANEQTLTFIDSLYKETGRVLASHGIETIEQIGYFNGEYQTIVETKKTVDISLDGKIAESYRPGYRINGKIIRTQDIAIYNYVENENTVQEDER